MSIDIKLVKRDNSPYYYLYWFSNGKIHRESTKTRNAKKAKRILKKKEGELLAHQGIEDYAETTVQDLVEEVIQDYKLNQKKSLDKVEQRAKTISAYFGPNKPVKDITEQDLSHYTLHRLEQPGKAKNSTISPATVNRELALIKRGFNLLLRKKVIGSKPHITLLKENNVREGFFEHWQYQALLKHLPNYLVPMVKFAYKSGWRKSEILNLKWEMIDLEEGAVYLPKKLSKNGRSRTFYLDDELKDALLDAFALSMGKGSGYIFTGPNGPIKDFRFAWNKACENAKIGKKLFHDLRRTVARNLIKAGVSEKVAQEVLGQQTNSVFKRYQITNDQDIKEAILKQQLFLAGLNTEPPEQPEELSNVELNIDTGNIKEVRKAKPSKRIH